MMSSEVKSAGPTSWAASTTSSAWERGRPSRWLRSMCLWRFSTITMAASIMAPMAMAIPPSDMMLALSPITRMASNVAAGFDLKLADRVGVTFEARDAMFSKFSRRRLNPIAAIDVNNRFTEDFPIPPAEKSNLNNFMFTLGFTFAPQGRRDSTDSGSTTTGER